MLPHPAVQIGAGPFDLDIDDTRQLLVNSRHNDRELSFKWMQDIE